MKTAPGMNSRSAFLIGAYGGEHLGDAAILGGVLLRLVRRERIDHAVVASFRPKRTQRLVGLIKPVVPLEVVPHNLIAVARHLRKADLLVWAGGPIVDHPRLLARNLRAALAARAYGIPFVIEGVGSGRVRRWMSKRMVNAILGLATSIAVRSNASASVIARLARRECRLVADPAFDYLATRCAFDLTTPQERARIKEFVSRPRGTLLVCINARPTTVRRSRRTFVIVLQRLAITLLQFANIRPVRYVFFPLEAEANTGADLEAAYELALYLPPDIDFRIWHELPGIDAILNLLHSSDAAVTMRLHAAIFALSQQIPIVAIDSKVGGRRGKVGQLFDDLGMGGNALNIANLEPDCIVRLLTDLTDRNSAHEQQLQRL
jgi:polysaccharide pyruvyl transferase WcaK-like protein